MKLSRITCLAASDFVAYLLENEFKVSRHNLKIVSGFILRQITERNYAKLPKNMMSNYRKLK